VVGSFIEDSCKRSRVSLNIASYISNPDANPIITLSSNVISFIKENRSR
jgi:hypothetical protein